MNNETTTQKRPAFLDQAPTTENSGAPETAYQFLKSLPFPATRPALKSYLRDRESRVVANEVAEEFTDNLRNGTANFYIPVSWSMTKDSLLNLLGITSHEGYSEVNGVRFYAGLNSDDQLTLIAVSTTPGTGCNDDLTVAEAYPYYDYADPCPNSCSSRGSLRALAPIMMEVARQ